MLLWRRKNKSLEVNTELKLSIRYWFRVKDDRVVSRYWFGEAT